MTAYDSSGNSRHGTLVNMESPGDWTAGKVDNALWFNNGSLDEYVACPRPTTVTDNWTLSAWICPAVLAPPGMGTFVYVGDDFAGYGML